MSAVPLHSHAVSAALLFACTSCRTPPAAAPQNLFVAIRLKREQRMFDNGGPLAISQQIGMVMMMIMMINIIAFFGSARPGPIVRRGAQGLIAPFETRQGNPRQVRYPRLTFRLPSLRLLFPPSWNSGARRYKWVRGILEQRDACLASPLSTCALASYRVRSN